MSTFKDGPHIEHDTRDGMVEKSDHKMSFQSGGEVVFGVGVKGG